MEVKVFVFGFKVFFAKEYMWILEKGHLREEKCIIFQFLFLNNNKIICTYFKYTNIYIFNMYYYVIE